MSPTLTSRVEGDLFTMERVFRASPAAVWAAWTEADQLARWFGPVGFTREAARFEARAGGRWALSLRGPDGVAYPVSGEVLRAEAPHLLELTASTEGYPESWYAAVADFYGPDFEPPLRFTMTVRLEAVPEGTRMTVAQRLPSAALARGNAAMGASSGYADGSARLDLMLCAVELPEECLLLTREIAAPAVKVFAALSDAAALDAWWGPNGFVNTTSAFDFRVGGEWLFDMVHPEYGAFPNRVRYTNIQAPERIDFLHDGGEGTRGFECSMWVEPLGPSRCRIHLWQRHPSAAVRAEVQAFGAVELGGQTLAKLARWVEAG